MSKKGLRSAHYIYGPVYSRRLGFSLGIDVISSKICSFECVYCQLGKTSQKTIRRFKSVNLYRFKKELKDALKRIGRIDYITISGSGEPTLHRDLDVIIREAKKISLGKIPVCVITNSSLLYRKDVREELTDADVIMPSLDAPTQEVFEIINRPHRGISFEKVIDGLVRLRDEYTGNIFLEVMLIKGYNDRKDYAYMFREIIEKIKPDKIFLTLPYRPAPLSKASLIPSDSVTRYFRKVLGRNCVLIGKFNKASYTQKGKVNEDEVYASLRRRPQTERELIVAFKCSKVILKNIIDSLLRKGRIYCLDKRRKIYCVR